MSVTSAKCFEKYGDPYKEKNLSLLYLPAALLAANPKLPKRIYLNNDAHAPLLAALNLAHARRVLQEIKTFDGAFNIRKIRGLNEMSLHSWAVAVDFNAAHNPLGFSYGAAQARGLKPFSEAFLQCFRETGWECGGDWKGRPDRQHYQLAKLP